MRATFLSRVTFGGKGLSARLIRCFCGYHSMLLQMQCMMREQQQPLHILFPCSNRQRVQHLQAYLQHISCKYAAIAAAAADDECCRCTVHSCSCRPVAASSESHVYEQHRSRTVRAVRQLSPHGNRLVPLLVQRQSMQLQQYCENSSLPWLSPCI